VDGDRVIPVANRLNPGDVVLVKASRAASLEGVAAGPLGVDDVREADR
jgi:UDP-N-acetylmuramyl pentapeptide synthase